MSRDEPKILVNGVAIYGPGDVGKGQTVNLGNRPALFTNSAQVQLVEVDAGADDDMGTVTVNGAANVHQGDRTREFHRTDANFEPTFRLIAA